MPQYLPSLKFVGAAALASVIAGVLVSYERGHTGESRLVKVTPASPEMMELLRDEHGLIANMVKVQIANEKEATPSNAVGPF
jgi:hypothetical protein